MTPEQDAQRIRQLEFQLYKAEHGMGMPYDREAVLALRREIEEYCKLLAQYDEEGKQ